MGLVRVATYRFRKVAQDAGTRGFLFDWGMVALMMSDSAARISVLILSRSSFHAPPARLGGRPRAAAALSVRFAVSSGERPLTGTGPTHSTNSRSVTVPSAHIGDSFRIAST